MTRTRAYVRRKWFALSVCTIVTGILSVQLWLPGFIGLANNGDFGKITSWIGLAPAQGWAPTYFAFFDPEYVWSQRNVIRSGFLSCEVAFAYIAQHLAHATNEGAHFDIRVLGAVHAFAYLAPFLLLVTVLPNRVRPVSQVAIIALSILVFTDVVYVAYLNSFYMDVPALCAILLLTTSAVCVCIAEQPSGFAIATFGIAGLLFVTSKTQHAIWAPVVAVFPIATAFRFRTSAIRWATIGISVALLGACAFMVASTPKEYRAAALFNVLFFRLGGRGQAALPDLLEIGIDAADARYIGMHAFRPDAPVSDPRWAVAFYERTGYRRLLQWYLKHPVRTVQLLDETLIIRAPQMRQNTLSNYRREDGYPKYARTNRFALWSNFRSALFSRWPHHIIIWYIVFVAGTIAVIRRATGTNAARLAWVALGVAVIASGEFLEAALADAIETQRHLLIFHVCTDLTICFAAAWLAIRVLGNHAAAVHAIVEHRHQLPVRQSVS
jgi:hypothetical protein